MSLTTIIPPTAMSGDYLKLLWAESHPITGRQPNRKVRDVCSTGRGVFWLVWDQSTAVNRGECLQGSLWHKQGTKVSFESRYSHFLIQISHKATRYSNTGLLSAKLLQSISCIVTIVFKHGGCFIRLGSKFHIRGIQPTRWTWRRRGRKGDAFERYEGNRRWTEIRKRTRSMGGATQRVKTVKYRRRI